MSVFEQRVMTKIYIDDTDVLVANIITSEYIDRHTVSKNFNYYLFSIYVNYSVC